MSLDELEQLMPVPPTETGDRPVIVVIDDDPSIRSSLLTVLKDKYTIRSCSNGIEGVRAVDDQVSCVILDVKKCRRTTASGCASTCANAARMCP